MTETVVIDGVVYHVPVISMKRKAEFLDKYAQRNAEGELRRELIGVFFNYQIQFGRSSVNEYHRLWEKLTEPEEFHIVKVPDEDGFFTFKAYFSNVGDEFAFIKDDGTTRIMTNLTVNFIAQKPARS
jgi:hypothetical protein